MPNEIDIELQNRARAKRVRNLVVICSLIAVVLSVSTYAWFIGMRTVNVSSFDVEIASTDSLMLSLNGATWSSTVAVSEDTLGTVSYAGHTNNWGGRGLIPMSSIGEMDLDASRMKIFEKASLTTTPGGYRLLASRVNNYDDGESEKDGYVVFDLFVKNFSGTQYIKELDELDEEAIYLTNDSEVTVANDGVKDTGIENSVRVAFAQIGRVAGTTSLASTITSITCASDEDGEGEIIGPVTGICRTAQIWEPNDTDHVANAISWYDTSCLTRTGANVTLKASYPDAENNDCGTILDGIAYPTYAVKAPIASTNNVDIYDGAEYNKYTSTALLDSYDYFTDTMKYLTGTSRPTFMTLAPNSITKVRIYIYIEGQDIDNYDFASIGKKISIKFGFTKERFTEDDINYNGPDLNQGTGPLAADLTVPVITLTGAKVMTLAKGTAFEEPGFSASDTKDGDVTADVKKSGTVNVDEIGTYKILYKVTDAAGNVATKTRYVIIE